MSANPRSLSAAAEVPKGEVEAVGSTPVWPVPDLLAADGAGVDGDVTAGGARGGGDATGTGAGSGSTGSVCASAGGREARTVPPETPAAALSRRASERCSTSLQHDCHRASGSRLRARRKTGSTVAGSSG